jgi:uncharacterized protein (TIGR02145 family)
MAENLNYDVDGSYCAGDDTGGDRKGNCLIYGKLYNWATAMNLPSSCNSKICSSQVQPVHQGVCSSGWHIPNDEEWTVLTDYVGGLSTAGTKLKATSGWITSSGYKPGTDDYGFSALPGGFNMEHLVSVGGSGAWWSAYEDNESAAYIQVMYYNFDFASWAGFIKSALASIRCLQD